jgi:hypothetical protein
MARFNDLLSGVQSGTISEAAVLVREVRVRIGVLSKYVSIRIYDDGKDPASFTFHLSALMKTGSDQTSQVDRRAAPNENEALRRAIRILTQNYDDAVRRGEMPDDQWLVDQASTARE